MTHRTMHVQPISGSLGAEIQGIDLRRRDKHLDEEIRVAFLKHKVIFFRDQQALTSQEYLDFASSIGQPSRYPYVASPYHSFFISF